MEQIDRSMAILIDAENISPKYIGLIIDEANKHGKLNYRRIYGDWTTVKLKKWKDACLKYALTPVQQFVSISGKNSSDFSLVIDAMDILYGGKTLGFCIISSDGDFTKLITRLKEDDMYLIGMGEEKTPISLVNSYESFTYLDKLFQTIEAEKKV
ncbi:MAG: NYN domain-containing protein, partial [Firmicutes bacterium]|nr:NYN domain-containing protein [Bacillota bacterium]